MWSKRYIFNPTKEEYFKTKHPIATASVLVPICVYYLYCSLNSLKSWWIILGVLGCLLFGIGLGYGFAVIRKLYEKAYLPVLCLIMGTTLVAIGLIFAS